MENIKIAENTPSLKGKREKLCQILREMGSVAVAFSGGVDSTFLLAEAHSVLGENAVAVTASSILYPSQEQKEAKALCEKRSIRQIILPFEELSIPGFRNNPTNRCYLCKSNLFSKIQEKAAELSIPYVLDGTNADDIGDYRPGLQAAKELGVRSPLLEAGLTKAEIRTISKDLGLPTWDKPASACLASRFVYGETIDEKKLSMIDKAEELLHSLGFRQVRVRVHGNLARIELAPSDFPRFMEAAIREQVFEYCKKLGFSYVTLDLRGYRTGSMNETLKQS